MAKRPPKQVTAAPSKNKLQRRYRSYGEPCKVEDIHAEHVSEDELMAMIRYAKAELLSRYKQHHLESTKKNLLQARAIWDLDKQEVQYKQVLRFSTEHLEVLIQVLKETNPHPDRIKKVTTEATKFCGILKQFLK